MDPRLLHYYNRELQFIREMGAEFAEQYPKIAARLGLEGLECADPYVERLLEGFAFLTARVQLKMDAEFPRFTEHLLEIVYPHYLAPTPSMAIVQFQPDRTQGALEEGFCIPRGTNLRIASGRDVQTASQYVTAHDAWLWPLSIKEAEYHSHPGALAALNLPDIRGAKAAIRLQLRTEGGQRFAGLPISSLPIFLRGDNTIAMRLYEQCFANTLAVVVRPATRPSPWQETLLKSALQPIGFRDDEALLPMGPPSFQGYRLLKEYFAFPQRFLFVDVTALGPAIRRHDGEELDLVFLLNRTDPVLEGAVTASNFGLSCVPAINLFPKRADRIHVSPRETEFHVVPDRTRPLDFEVYQITDVTGFEAGGQEERRFLPFYSASDLYNDSSDASYYTVHRAPRLVSSQQRRHGRRSSYAGNEVYISLVDSNEALLSLAMRQLSVGTLCTNRDLPLFISVGGGETDFTMELGAPIESIRCIAGPTRPRPGLTGDNTAWRIISHLSLNYLSIADNDAREGAASLRDLLRLYVDEDDIAGQQEIDAVKSAETRSIIRRITGGKMLTFGSGLEVSVTCDESAFAESRLFLFGAVMEQFFARYVSLNSFTETVIKSLDRGEVMRWPARIGRRTAL